LCWQRSRLSVTHNRPFWRILLLALCAKLAAYALLAADAWVHTDGTLVAVDPAFHFCVSALLMVVAASYNPGSPVARWTNLIDGILAASIAWLFYDLLHVQLPPSGQSPAAALFLSRMFDGMDLFVAAFATLRLLASRRADERRFFFVLASYAWLDALCAGAHNRLILASESYLPELLHAVPPAVLGVLLSRRRAWLRGYRPSRLTVNLTASIVPFALSLALTGLALVLLPSEPVLARVMILLAVVAYGARNALLTAHHLSVEDERRVLRRSLQQSVFQDELTGLANRRGIQRALERAWERAVEQGEALAVAMMDIDHFKAFNDTYGHLAGDDCLSAVGATLRNGALAHAGVTVGRYGGEEFLMLFEGTAAERAGEIVEALRARVGGLQILHAGNHPSRTVTASAGVAAFQRGRHRDLERLLKAADEALYEAKAAGRNRLGRAEG
ncbi:MAG TPA: GGDEF domain-containing protein, partial [Candidatus Saccharimonadales bacterium]|nr:GGDEF domain-containing protein [Candidatus Saccharimonadales bacterium]